MNEAVQVAIIVVTGWVISVCLHEFAHALVAYLGGDSSVKSKGYLYLNPFAYTDIWWSVLLPTLFILIGGIGLPGASVQIQSERLKNSYWSSLVSAAGPLTTFAFVLLLIGLIRTGTLPETWLFSFCWLLNIEIVVLILNLLPVPGLDGFGIIEPLLSESLRMRLRPFYKYGMLIIILLIFVIPGPNHLIWAAAMQLMNLAGIPALFVERGEYLYARGSFPVAALVLAVGSLVLFCKKHFDWYLKGEKLLRLEKYDECANLMRRVIARSDDARAYKLNALACAGLAEKSDQAESSGCKTEALASIEKCLKLEPEACENWMAKGLVCESIGDLDLALEAYEKALQLNKNFDYAFARYCSVLWKKNEIDSMLSACDQRLSILPSDGEPLFQKGIALTTMEQFEEALACFEKCISLGVHEDLSRKNREIVLNAIEKTSSNPTEPSA